MFVDPPATEHRGPSPRRLTVTADNFVNESYAVSHHYRSCYTARHIPTSCDRLLAKTYLDDTVIRYRDQLITNVRRTLGAFTGH